MYRRVPYPSISLIRWVLSHIFLKRYARCWFRRHFTEPAPSHTPLDVPVSFAPPHGGVGVAAGVDYPLPAGVTDCSSSSLEDNMDVLSEEDKELLPSSFPSLEEALSSVDAILITS
jgi:hypothetical protein